MTKQYNRNRHSCYKLTYHLVVVTKYRKKVINKEILEYLNSYSKTIFNKWGCNILEINGEEDHLHILFEGVPQLDLSKLINNFKTTSSRMVRKTFKSHVDNYYWKPYFWSSSYLILSTGGATIEVIKNYIKNQDSPN